MRLRFDILLIEAVGHRLHIVDDGSLCDVAEEHPVRTHINCIKDLQTHITVRIFVQIRHAVCRHIIMIKISKLIDIASGLEAEMLKDLERAFLIQNADIQHAGLAYDLCRVIALDEIDGDLSRVTGDLRDCVDDLTIGFLAVVTGCHIQTVTDLVESLLVDLVLFFYFNFVVALGQLFSHCHQLFGALIIERRENGDIVLGISNVLQTFHLLLHHTHRGRGPGTVLDKSNGLLLEITLNE